MLTSACYQVKDHKVKKVKEMNVSPFVSSENSLMAESSFINGKHKPNFANGCFLEWTENVANSASTSHSGHDKVMDSRVKFVKSSGSVEHEFIFIERV